MTDGVQAERQERELNVTNTFVELVGSIIAQFDVVDLLTTLVTRSVEILGIAEAGILLADSDGNLRVLAASSEEVGLLELFQLQNDGGPCHDCYVTGQSVVVTDLRVDDRWPLFAAECITAGYPSVCALPLRHRQSVFGSLNLFMAEATLLGAADVVVAQAFADVASIAIVQDAAKSEATERENQLQHALDSRVAIEQAKGMIAERANVDMDEAFSRLRSFARATNRGLTEVASSLVAGSRDFDAVIASRQPPPRPQRQ